MFANKNLMQVELKLVISGLALLKLASFCWI